MSQVNIDTNHHERIVENGFTHTTLTEQHRTTAGTVNDDNKNEHPNKTKVSLVKTSEANKHRTHPHLHQKNVPDLPLDCKML